MQRLRRRKEKRMNAITTTPSVAMIVAPCLGAILALATPGSGAECLWPADGERRDDSAPLTTEVVAGDAISFVLEKAADGSRKECPLDQVVTYLVDDAKSQKDHRPSTR
jgi:hypothetical protein